MRARAALFLLVGLGFLVFWGRQESGWWDPLPDSDTGVLLGFSALLAGLGASLLLWSPDKRSTTVSATAAFGAAGTNLLEDGLGLSWAFLPFVACTLTLLIGQLAMAVRSPLSRAVVPALSALALATFPLAGGPLLALSWTTAAALLVHRPARSLAANDSQMAKGAPS